MNIAVLFTNYGPYHIARIQAFHQACSDIGWSVTGIELSRFEAEYPWRSPLSHLPFPIHSVVEDQEIEQVPLTRLIPALYRLLNQVKPDGVAIAGYARPAMLAALAWSRWHRKPAILFSETTAADFTRSPVKERLKRWLVNQYQAALVGGQPQKRYLMALGMQARAIALGYDVVGNDGFHPDRIQSLPRPVDRPYFLTINRFVQKKNLPFVINAYAAYRQMVGESAWDLVLCGDGELRSHLESQIQSLELTPYVHLPGFLQQEELFPYFAHAGCFIHASTHEQWGLVVNEAMAAGLPVLVSDRCGCFEDLVIEGHNGFGFDPENPQMLTQLMHKLSMGAVDLTAMGQAALAHIQQFSPDYFAQGLLQAVEYSIRSPGPPDTRSDHPATSP
jgi:1,2-diacylglycerol 3-alpha-glucosyltransferase